MKRRLRFPATTLACLLTVILIVVALLGDTNIVSVPAILRRIELHEIDDILVGFGLVPVALCIDHLIAAGRTKRQAAIEAQRLRALKATMRTVHDIVNNFLNSLQLVRLEAESVLPAESLESFDRLIGETSAKLKALGDLERVAEKSVGGGIGIDYGQE